MQNCAKLIVLKRNTIQPCVVVPLGVMGVGVPREEFHVDLWKFQPP